MPPEGKLPSPTRSGTGLPAPPTGLLTGCWRDFRRLDWKWHFLALATLIGVLAVHAAAVLRSDSPTIDEATYERAFAAVAEGRSPYQSPGYYYPAAFAYFGAFLVEGLGVNGARTLFRWLNLGGSALTCWLAAAWWWSTGRSVRTRFTERLLVALVLMLVAPGVGAGLATGNFSLTASSWINLALHTAGSWPILAGAILGASLITKPLAAIVLPVFAGAALSPRAGRMISPVTVVVASVLASGGFLLLPYFSEMLALEVMEGTLGGTISLLRVAHLFDFELHQVLLLVLLSPLAFLAGRRYATDRVALICSSLALVMVTSPAIWPYTATVFFPVPVMALSVARSRYEARYLGPVPARQAGLEVILVAALAIAVLFLNGGAFDRLPRGPQIVLLLAQLAAPVLLAGYVLRSAASRQSGEFSAAAETPDRLSA